MDGLKLFIPITKVDEEKRLVYGRLAEESPDSIGEIFDYESSKPYYQEWSSFFQKATDGKSYGNLRVQHDPQRNAGHLVDIVMLDDEKAIDICAKVNDDDEWARLLDGDYTGFSQGGKYVEKWADGKHKRFTAQPNEASLVDYPSHKNCTFQLIKADGSVEDHLFKIAERKDVNPESGKKKYGDVKFADEKNKKYPIDSEAHIRAAWNYINKPKNAGKYSADDLKTIKGKIIAAWKSKIDKDGPPSAAKKGETEGDMRKAEILADLKKWAGQEISDASIAIHALSDIVYLYTMEEGEDHPEATDQIDALKAVIENLKNFIASEIIESDEDDVINRVAKFDEGQMSKLCETLGLEKKGAAISAANLTKVQAIHDHAVGMGAKCNKEAAEPAGDLQKVEGERDEAVAKVATLTTENATLKAAAGEAIGTITELKIPKEETDTIGTVIKKMHGEIEKLKAEPAPAKGVTRIVTKADDTGSTKKETAIEIDPDDPKSIEKAAQELIKVSHSRPLGVVANKPPEIPAAVK